MKIYANRHCTITVQYVPQDYIFTHSISVELTDLSRMHWNGEGTYSYDIDMLLMPRVIRIQVLWWCIVISLIPYRYGKAGKYTMYAPHKSKTLKVTTKKHDMGRPAEAKTKLSKGVAALQRAETFVNDAYELIEEGRHLPTKHETRVELLHIKADIAEIYSELGKRITELNNVIENIEQ